MIRLCPLLVASLCTACAASALKPAAKAPPSAQSALPAIVAIGAPVLRARAAEVAPERIVTREIQDLIATMIATMRAAPGVGLAAPQIGVSLRIIVLEDRADTIAKLTEVERRERERVAFGPRVIVNPVLRPVGDARVAFFEGCLSVNGYAGVVDRHAEVDVTGLDEHGTPFTWRVRGWPARILQHEVDHLDGTVYVDRMRTRSFSTSEQVKARFGGKPIAEILDAVGP